MIQRKNKLVYEHIHDEAYEEFCERLPKSKASEDRFEL